MSGTPALEVRGIEVTYGSGAVAVPALRGLSLAFEPGTFTAVMGPSGSGKTTFLTCAGLLEPPDAGQVLLAGRDVSGLSAERRTPLRRDQVGFVFQGFHLMPYLSAEQNVALPLRLAGRRVSRSRVRGLLERVGLGEHIHRLPGELSGGQQQRVAIARALVTSPAVVLADEPTGALDTANAASVLALLRTTVGDASAVSSASGSASAASDASGSASAASDASGSASAASDASGSASAVVMVTHDPVAAAYANRVVFLVDGCVAGEMSNPSAEAVAAQMAHLDELTGRTLNAGEVA